MELKVWVEGIQRVVCGVSDTTTCQDVVIALAHATGKTGRFTLIERWRDNERLVAPAQCPLKLLRDWGEYANDVQFVLRHSAEKSRKNPKSIYKHPHGADKLLHGFMPQIDAQPRGIVKRNLTFSGAHHSMPPPRENARKTAPFENSSLDSVEEQSSLSSHSSSSPYSSFQYSSTADPMRNRPPFSHYRHEHLQHPQTIVETSKSVSPSSPVGTPTNKVDRQLRRDKRSELLHRRDRNLDPAQGHRHGSSPDRLPPAHKVMSSSLPANQNMNHLFMSDNFDKLSPRASPHGYASHARLIEDREGREKNRHINTPQTSAYNHSSRVTNTSRNVKDTNCHRTGDNTGYSLMGDDSEIPPDYHSQSPSSAQQPLLDSSSETDENKNSKKSIDYDAIFKGEGLQQVSRDDLVKLVNLQIERLNSQESHMKTLDADISLWDVKESEAAKRVKLVESEISQLESKDRGLQGDLEELEIVSWAEKLEMERQAEKRLRMEIEGVHTEISSHKVKIEDLNARCQSLERELEEERRKEENDKKEMEMRILREICELQQEINEKLLEYEQCERSLEEISAHVKQLESAILDKKMQMATLEKELKGVNLDLFNSKPEESLNGKEKSETCVQFTRSSSSRPGSSRKMPTTPAQLKDAIQSEPQGYWV